MSELGTHNGAGNRYVMYLSAPQGGVAQMLRSPDGNWVPYEDYALLKAEVERLKEDNRQLTKAFEIAEGIIKRMGKAAEDAAKEGKPSV